MEKIESDWNPDIALETQQIEDKLRETLDSERIVNIFGKETYLIGGYIRDVILGKNTINSDLDLMTRTPVEIVLSNLERSGYAKSAQPKFPENGYSMKEGTGVLNTKISGREIQVGFVGNKDINDIISEGDLNLNCCAYDISNGKIVDPEILSEIRRGELKFCSAEKAREDPMKIVSALKQVSRLPELSLSVETRGIITGAMPTVIKYFRENADRRHKLDSLFGNINSGEIRKIFLDYGAEDLLKDIPLKKPFLRVSEKYLSCPVDTLDSDTKEKITNLLIAEYGRRVNVNKIFDPKVNSVAYELDAKGDVIACCLIDGERLYAVSAINAERIVNLVTDLCRNNYTLWATASIKNKQIINLALKAGLRLIDNPDIIRKIMIANYPQYEHKIRIEARKEFMTFSKSDSQDQPQVVLLS